MNFQDEDLERLDVFAKKQGLKRNAAVILMLTFCEKFITSSKEPRSDDD